MTPDQKVRLFTSLAAPLFGGDTGKAREWVEEFALATTPAAAPEAEPEAEAE